MKTINSEEKPLNIYLKSNNTLKTLKPLTSNTLRPLSIIRIFWLLSFVSWIIFTFFTEGKTSSIGMWTSLSFMWIFLLIHHLSKYK